jgi:hypothetical protein
MNALLIVGAKGGVGTTLVAQELIKVGKTLVVDAADGTLAARLGRPTWNLTYEITTATGEWRATLIEQALKKRVTLLWTPANGMAEAPWEFVRDLARRTTLVIDGGVQPPIGIDALTISATAQIVIVTQPDNSVAQWHVVQLQQRYPQASVITGTRQAARELADQLFKGVQTP